MIVIKVDETNRPHRSDMPRGRRWSETSTCEQAILVGGAIAAGFVSAGIVFTLLLSLGVNMSAAAVAGLIVSAGSALILWRRTAIDDKPRYDAVPFGGSDVYVRIENIVSATAVDDLEDSGPGYVVETAEGERVYLAGEVLGDIDEGGEFLRETIVLHVAGGGGEILKATTHGRELEVCGSCSLESLPIDETVGFAVLEEGADHAAQQRETT